MEIEKSKEKNMTLIDINSIIEKEEPKNNEELININIKKKINFDNKKIKKILGKIIHEIKNEKITNFDFLNIISFLKNLYKEKPKQFKNFFFENLNSEENFLFLSKFYLRTFFEFKLKAFEEYKTLIKKKKNNFISYLFLFFNFFEKSLINFHNLQNDMDLLILYNILYFIGILILDKDYFPKTILFLEERFFFFKIKLYLKTRKVIEKKENILLFNSIEKLLNQLIIIKIDSFSLKEKKIKNLMKKEWLENFQNYVFSNFEKRFLKFQNLTLYVKNSENYIKDIIHYLKLEEFTFCINFLRINIFYENEKFIDNYFFCFDKKKILQNIFLDKFFFEIKKEKFDLDSSEEYIWDKKDLYLELKKKDFSLLKEIHKKTINREKIQNQKTFKIFYSNFLTTPEKYIKLPHLLNIEKNLIITKLKKNLKNFIEKEIQKIYPIKKEKKVILRGWSNNSCLIKKFRILEIKTEEIGDEKNKEITAEFHINKYEMKKNVSQIWEKLQKNDTLYILKYSEDLKNSHFFFEKFGKFFLRKVQIIEIFDDRRNSIFDISKKKKIREGIRIFHVKINSFKYYDDLINKNNLDIYSNFDIVIKNNEKLKYLINLTACLNKNIFNNFGNFQEKVFLENNKNIFEVVNSVCEKEKISYINNILKKNVFLNKTEKLENTGKNDNIKIKKEENDIKKNGLDFKNNKVLIISKSKNYLKKIGDFINLESDINRYKNYILDLSDENSNFSILQKMNDILTGRKNYLEKVNSLFNNCGLAKGANFTIESFNYAKKSILNPILKKEKIQENLEKSIFDNFFKQNKIDNLSYKKKFEFLDEFLDFEKIYEYFEILRNRKKREEFLLKNYSKVILIDLDTLFSKIEFLRKNKTNFTSIIFLESENLKNMEIFFPLTLSEKINKVFLFGTDVLKKNKNYTKNNLWCKMAKNPHFVKNLKKNHIINKKILKSLQFLKKGAFSNSLVNQDMCFFKNPWNFMNIKPDDKNNNILTNLEEAEFCVSLFIYLVLKNFENKNIENNKILDKNDMDKIDVKSLDIKNKEKNDKKKIKNKKIVILTTTINQKNLILEIIEKKCGFYDRIGFPFLVSLISDYKCLNSDFIIFSFVKKNYLNFFKNLKKFIYCITLAKNDFFVFGNFENSNKKLLSYFKFIENQPLKNFLINFDSKEFNVKKSNDFYEVIKNIILKE